jgi:hypothetical protein
VALLPAEPLSDRVGKKAARATPISALAAATRRSAAAMSGRRSSSVEGTPTGTSGSLAIQLGSAAMRKALGDSPTSTAMAFS